MKPHDFELTSRSVRRSCLIAAPFWWQARAVLAFNEEDMHGLQEGSKLKQGTLLRLPQIHVTKSEDETCTSIADRFGKNEIWPDRTSFDGHEILDLQNKARSTLSTLFTPSLCSFSPRAR